VQPEALAGLSDESLRAVGLSRNKAASLRDLAAKVLDGTVVLSPLGDPYRPYRSVAAWYCWRAAELYADAADSALTR
jgi:3-methyladenine DNA glycosylase/8-oxoguanine DNA glycosylase